MPRSAKRRLSYSAASSSSSKKSKKTVTLSKSLATRVKGLLKSVETKEWGNSTSITPTTTPQALATGAAPWQIVQGQTDSTRIGNKITVIKMQYTGYLTATTAQEVTLVVCQDKQCNGAVISPGSVYVDASGNLNDAYHGNVRALDNKSRYVILGRKTLNFTANVLSMPFSFTIRKRIDFEYGSNTGLITSLTDNNIQLLYGSRGSTATCSGPVNVNIMYEDM